MRAIPKSAIFARSSLSKRMFAGFRSRWTRPRSCACASPAAVSVAMRSVSSSSIRPRLQPVLERAVRQVLEHHVAPTGVLAVVVDRRDVRVRERRGRARLALEAGGVGLHAEHLDRDTPAELLVLSEPDGAHRPASQRFEQAVTPGDHLRSHVCRIIVIRRERPTEDRRGPRARPGASRAARGGRRPRRRRVGTRACRARAGADRPAAVRQLGDGRLRGARRGHPRAPGDRRPLGGRPAGVPRARRR